MASLDFVTTANSTTDASSYTFSGVSLGAADADRHIVVLTGARASSVRTITGVTVQGISATELRDSSADQTNGSIWIAAVPTGTTGDIVLTYSGTMVRANIAVFRGVGINPTPVDVDSHGIAGSSSAARTVTLDSVAGGFAVGGFVGSGTSPTLTWSGITEDYDFSYETGGNRASGAHGTTASTSVTVTATPSGSFLDGILVAATFQASASPVDVPADPGALSLTGVTPDLVGTGGAPLPADVAGVTLTGVTPTVVGSGSTVIAVDPAVLSLTGQDPAPSGSGTAPVSVDPGELTLTGVTPATDSTIVVVVDPGILVLGGQTPTVAGSGAASIAADVALLALAPVEAAVSGAGAVAIAVDSALLTLSGQESPLAGSGSAALVVEAAIVILTGVNPLVVAGGGMVVPVRMPLIVVVPDRTLTVARPAARTLESSAPRRTLEGGRP